jgi:phospholipase/carboxylesterase
MLDSTLLEYEIVETAINPTRAVIWLHGLGADGFDFVPIVKQLGLPEQADIRFIFPHAPISPVTINGGYEMRSWYDISSMDFQEAHRSNPEDIAQSSAQISHLLDKQIQSGIKPDKIILAGFSQGGVIALHTALQYPQRLAGIMPLSTYFPNADASLTGAPKTHLDLPVFSAHGINDEVIPHQLATIYRQKLSSFKLTSKDYHMGHSVCEEEIRDIAKWLVFTLF